MNIESVLRKVVPRFIKKPFLRLFDRMLRWIEESDRKDMERLDVLLSTYRERN